MCNSIEKTIKYSTEKRCRIVCEEVEGQKGGPAIDGSVNVPLNMDCAKQSERPTTVEEYKAKLEAAGFLPADAAAAIITHCGSGGRGGKAAAILRELGAKFGLTLS